MRQNSRADPKEAKKLARKKYAERQIDRWVKWTMENKGFMLYKDLIQKQEEFNIVCYG
jgi:hypothetical protein